MNSWNNIELFCGNGYEDEMKMVLKTDPHSVFYACPHYYSKEGNRMQQTFGFKKL